MAAKRHVAAPRRHDGGRPVTGGKPPSSRGAGRGLQVLRREDRVERRDPWHPRRRARGCWKATSTGRRRTDRAMICTGSRWGSTGRRRAAPRAPGIGPCSTRARGAYRSSTFERGRAPGALPPIDPSARANARRRSCGGPPLRRPSQGPRVSGAEPEDRITPPPPPRVSIDEGRYEPQDRAVAGGRGIRNGSISRTSGLRNRSRDRLSCTARTGSPSSVEASSERA